MALYCAIAALLGTAVSIVCLVILHVLPTGMNPLRDAVSRYGISPYKNVYRAGTIGLGVAGIAIALCLPQAVQNDATVATTGLVVFGLAQGLIGWFPDDVDAKRGEQTRTGQRHYILVVLFYGGATVAAFGYSSVFPASSLYASTAGILDVLSWVMLALDVVILLTMIRALRPFRGLAERLLHIPIYLWVILVAIPLLGAQV